MSLLKEGIKMKDTGSSKQITTMTFIGMTCALVASVRNIPDVAATSWTMIFYMLVAVLLYAFPISLISGEFAGMFPKKGGPELWVSNALGKNGGSLSHGCYGSKCFLGW